MLEIKSVTRRYGTTLANDQISLMIQPGKITGLLGENGAGKTTLLSILSGFDRPDEGELLIGGLPVSFRGPGDALANGIALVHQHLSLVPVLTVREQLRLAGWDGRGNPLPGLHLESRIEQLTLAQRQQVEIAKALLTKPKVLLLDEPTSILAADQIEGLFEQLRALAAKGTAVVLVSHKLREVLSVADEILVLRRGRLVDELARSERGWPSDVEERLLGAMFGEGSGIDAVSFQARGYGSEGSRSGRSLQLAPTVGSDARPDLALHIGGDGVELAIGQGELLAVVGIDGQGQDRLMDRLVGRDLVGVSVSYGGKPVSEVFFERRVGRVSDDRLGTGSIGSMTLAENLLLGRQDEPGLQRFGLVSQGARKRLVAQAISEWDIRPADPKARLETFSGGNIQRAILARELGKNPAWLVANNPTHGLDARTAERVWERLRAYCAEGGIVIALLSDLDESLNVASHVAVIHQRRVSEPIPVAQSDRPTLQAMMVSGW